MFFSCETIFSGNKVKADLDVPVVMNRILILFFVLLVLYIHVVIYCLYWSFSFMIRNLGYNLFCLINTVFLK